MPNRPTRRAHSTALTLLTVGLTATALGCFRHTEVVTTITNPLRAGGVMPNEVQQQNANEERRYQVPAGTLTDSASLTSMDANETCFHVTLRALDGGNGQTWTDIPSWHMSMLTGDVEIVEPTAQLDAPTAQQYNGRTRQRVQTGTQSMCVENGRARPRAAVTSQNPCRGRWEQRPVYENRWVPAIITVTTATGMVCFQNQGHVTPETTMVTLKMEKNRRRLDFTWELN